MNGGGGGGMEASTSEELIDALDHNGNIIGVVGRRFANRTGVLHLCAQIFVLVRTEQGMAVIFQRRSTAKRVSPGVLDISASGHVTHGDTVEETAVRELAEELGIVCAQDDMVNVGRRVDFYEAPGVLSRIFGDVFILVLDQMPESVAFDPDEIDELVVVTVNQLFDLFENNTRITCAGYRQTSGKLSEIETDVDRDQFLPRFDNLYLRVATYAQSVAAGRTPSFL
jgi:isopentenyldiphosphate isomerase